MRQDSLTSHINALTPDHLKAYLMTNGWSHDGDLNYLASIWHRPEKEHHDLEVLLPLTKDLKDYRERIIDALLTIATFENLPPVEIAKAAIGQLTDLVRIRVIHHDVNGGTIPLKDGVQLNLHARELMIAAALSTQMKRRLFTGKRSPEVTAFLESLRLGQTEEGSYIVNIIAPAKPSPETKELFPTVPLSNIVTDNLTSSLSALEDSIERFETTNKLSSFDSAVQSGASANLCDALVGLSGSEKQRSFEITVVPSPKRESTSRVITQSFVFDPERVDHIATASQYLKGNYVLKNQIISGQIKRLDRAADEEVGTIVVAATINSHEKHVALQLEPEQYQEAITAHGMKEEVRCIGDLHVSARKARLLNPSGFTVLTSGNLFNDLKKP